MFYTVSKKQIADYAILVEDIIEDGFAENIRCTVNEYTWLAFDVVEYPTRKVRYEGHVYAYKPALEPPEKIVQSNPGIIHNYWNNALMLDSNHTYLMICNGEQILNLLKECSILSEHDIMYKTMSGEVLTDLLFKMVD